MSLLSIQGHLIQAYKFKLLSQRYTGGIPANPLFLAPDKRRVVKLDDFSKTFQILLYSPVKEHLHLHNKIKYDGLVKSRKQPFFVIPAKAGIQSFQVVAENLDPVLQRGDDF